MKLEVILRAAVAVSVGSVILGCGSSDRADGEVPAMLRHQFEVQMKTILHDVKVAEEQAMALDGAYLELEPLKAKYLNRVVPENYTLTIEQVTEEGFRAEMMHTASGLACYLESGGSGAGIPKCD